MRKVLAFGLIAAIVGSAFVAAPAVAKKKKKPSIVQVDQKFFLRRDDCGGEDNTRLSTEDGPDAACWYVDAGLLYEAIDRSGQFDVSEAYPAENGVPFVLDATKPIGGEITLYGGSCAVDGAPCSPAGIAAGQATLKVRVFGSTGGEEKALGTFEESFVAVPGQNHTSKVEIKLDAELNGLTFDDFRVQILRGGAAYGPGGIEYDDPASFVTVPVLAQA